MAQVIHSINATVNGLCHHLDSVIGDEHNHYAVNLLSSADVLILGKNTFQLFVEFWPAALNNKVLDESTLALAQALNDVPKWVVSSKPTETSWNNTRQISGPELESLAKELATIKGKAVIFGSPSLATSLLKAGLIDELHIVVQPFVGSNGPQLYKDMKERTSLTFISAKPLQESSVLLRYKVEEKGVEN